MSAARARRGASLAVMEALAASGRRRSPGAPPWTRWAPGLLVALVVCVTCCALCAGVAAYDAVFSAREKADQTRMAHSFIANTVMANDDTGSVGSMRGPEGAALVLTRATPAGRVDTSLFLYRGMLMQQFSLAGTAIAVDLAEPVAPTSTFSFSFDDGLLTVVTDEGPVTVALRSQNAAVGGGPHG